MRRPVFLFRNLLFLAGLLLFLPISLAHAASAENRVALVIGQSAYRAVPALPNAENDGKRMAELLTNAGFDVTAAPDLSQNDMRQTISDFAAKVAASGPDTIALVFYAGHGLQIDGENYLVPIDVDPKREADIPLQAVRLNDLLNTLGALPTRMRIIMLDACAIIRSRRLTRLPATAWQSSIPRPAPPVRSFPIPPRRARRPRTAPAPTAPTRRRCSGSRSSRICRSRKPSNASGLP